MDFIHKDTKFSVGRVLARFRQVSFPLSDVFS
jgi:hypothetical protein